MSFTAFIYFKDGTADRVPNIDKHVFEWLYEELDDERLKKGLYLQRTDGGTVVLKAGIKRIDVVEDADIEVTPHDA